MDPRRAVRGLIERLALDTNILADAEGVNGAARREATHDLIRRLPVSTVVVPVQVLGELFTVLVRKAGRSPASARKAILGWHDTFQIADTNSSVMLMAFDLAADHKICIVGFRHRRCIGVRRMPIAVVGRHAGRIYLERHHHSEPVCANPQ